MTGNDASIAAAHRGRLGRTVAGSRAGFPAPRARTASRTRGQRQQCLAAR